MKLSICMMVKNEEKFLDKCLSHLNELMKYIDSELIIVDTGSEDKTVNIAREYTNKIYYHKWNNNFSEMRNITISYAIGEWILIIDADEMLIDYDDIIKFFGGEYIGKYNTVFLNVKNLSNSKDITTYSILSSPRIFRNDGEFKYEGAVHNEPIFKEPCAYINSMLEHYGYVFDDSSFTERKFERTATILKNELKKAPDNMYYWYQLSVSYSIHDEKNQALNCANKAFCIMETKIDKKNRENYIYIYTQLALSYLQLDMLEKVEEICVYAVEDNIKHIDVYYLLGKSRLLLGKNKEAIEAYEDYLEALNCYENNCTVQTYYHGKREYVLFELFVLYKRIEDYNKSIKYYNEITEVGILTHEEAIEENINLYINKNDYYGLKNFYNKIVSKYNKKNIFILYLEKYKGNSKVDSNQIKWILNEQDLYTDLLEFRLAIYSNDIELLNNYEIISDIKETDFNEVYYFYGDILYYFMINSFEKFIDSIKNVKEIKIIEFFKYLDNKYNDFINLLLNMLSFNIEEELCEIRIKKIIAKYLVAVTKFENLQYKEIFDLYVQYGVDYIEKIYNLEILESEEIYLLDDEELAFFVYMRKAQMKKYLDEKEYIRYLKMALNIYPYMHNGIKILLEELKNRANNNEMEIYKIQVIKTIKNLINDEKINEAKELLNEYEKIVSDDPEINAIKSMFT